ncbi:hypothetical protein LTR78_010395 [Recurvomyces mirabilis]|uniref:Uncharacterized protein n=1 Tax=Recurvomyces mirabilis TaxID=574656 RepID=A0AAE0WGW6_9PEZI|nr:hypothetical protein LTR78_010395 [Recurvomyces mirabilis]KAK5149770.1 hypothetical protein LTS14_010691 [Recurvomyces mirabilis]
MATSLSKTQKLSIIIGISFSFFIAEIAVGFYTHSLALIADAFHYASERDQAPPELSFGWQRATLLGGFFNGVFLLALGVSIFLQAIERFVAIEEHDHDVEHAANIDPRIGSIDGGSAPMEMERPHKDDRHAAPDRQGQGKPERDLGLMGILIHVAGDAANNLGVILVGAVIWKTHSPGRYYVDPAISITISIMIFASAVPLVKKSGLILLQSVPKGVNPVDVMHDMEQTPGVQAVHELHIWRLNQQKSVASAHIVVDNLPEFMTVANAINECLHSYGIHSVTLQPEVDPSLRVSRSKEPEFSEGVRLTASANACLCEAKGFAVPVQK